MAEFLLIHGAAHGAWCWRDVLPELAAHGHQARAIDLPSHGADTTPYQQVTLSHYADRIVEELKAMGPEVIMVGHSMGGYPITLAAEQFPQKIKQLVYLCAYVPKPGVSLNDRRREAAEQPLLEAIELTDDGFGWTVAEEALQRLFYHDCPPGTLDYARANLSVQARQPTTEPVATSSQYDQIPCSYIRCLNDHTIPLSHQIVMSDGWPSDHVFSMDCGHSPFFADPKRLAGHLDMIAQR